MKTTNEIINFYAQHVPVQRLGIASWHWAKAYYASQFSLFDAVGLAAQTPIRLIELNDFMLPPPRFSRLIRPILTTINAPAELWRYRRASIIQLKETFAQSNCTCICWTLNTDFTMPGRMALLERYWRSGIEAAGLLGAPFLRINVGGEKGLGQVEDVIANLCRFLALAFQLLPPDCAIIVENHWGHSAKIDEHLTIFQAAKTQLADVFKPRFGLCLDAANLETVGGDYSAEWQKMIPHALHVHLKSTREQQPIPITDLINLLKQNRYDGVYIIEDIASS